MWLTEHHFSRHGIVSDSLMVLAHLAARTSSVRLGTAVSVLPLHHPVRLAEAAATVDQLSGGRLDLGIGRGYQPGEFRGFGVDIAEKHDRFAEALDVLRPLWSTEGPVSHSGRLLVLRGRLPPAPSGPAPASAALGGDRQPRRTGDVRGARTGGCSSPRAPR